MKNNNFALVIALAVIFLVSSCAKEGPSGPTGPAGPSYTGSISGHVSLYDQYGSRVLTGIDSVKITLISSTSTGTPINADNTGYYFFSNTVTGQYDITATDSGYGATNTNNFQFLSGTLNHDIKLSAIPTFSVGITAGSGATYDTVVVNCTSDPQVRSFVLFLGSTPAVSNAPSTFLFSTVKNIPANSVKVTNLISAQELYDAGLASGSKVYFAVYSGAVSDQSVYEDQSTGKNVYNAVSNPQVDSAIVP